ncbi:MAG TPA: hypothetical protein VM889_03620 [Candidatus Thermoplasmatota archaeon]|nr:hypothetical protein [Candidatus Thermoplasmatota archaeon]
MRLKATFCVATTALVLLPTVLAAPPRVVEDPADADLGPLDILGVWITSNGQAITVTAAVRDLSQPDPVAHNLDYYHVAVRLYRSHASAADIDLHAEVYLRETSHRGLPNARYLGMPRESPHIPSEPGTYAWLHTGHAHRYYLDDVTVRFDPGSSTITWTVPYTMMRQGSVFAPAKVADQVFRSNEVLKGSQQHRGPFAETMMTYAGLTVDEVTHPSDYSVTLV